MSFFVSKEIEEIVDEACLIDPDKPKEYGIHLFDTESLVVFSMIDEITHTDVSKNLYEVSFKANTNIVERVYLKKTSLSIKINSTAVSLDSYYIINLKRVLDDSYIVKLRCHLSEENNNV